MMPETIPSFRDDKGFQKDAELYATGVLKNRTLRVDDFYLSLKNIIISAYLNGGQHGFQTGWRIKEMEAKR